MKKLLLSTLLILMVLTGCKKEPVDNRSDDIVILFTNDIHGAVDDGITLAGVSLYKKLMETKSKYVTLVDCGDAIQGSSVTLASQGEVSIDAMNVVGYDYAIFGNHEFDYGFERLDYLMQKANAQYLNSNVTYTGSNIDHLANTKPYDIKQYGDTKVAFIGITTPESLISSTPTNFIEDGKTVYSFNESADGKAFYEGVQKVVDEVKEKGADYVIALAHLGNSGGDTIERYSSNALIANTEGIDVLLDGHSHSVYLHHMAENKNGDSYVYAGQTGTKLENLGKLVIDQKGLITITLIDDITRVDVEAEAKINEYLAGYSKILDEVIATSTTALSTSDANGVRMVRNRETNIGDFVSDAYRAITGAEISYINGGGIRDDIPAGEITLNTLVSVAPFGNSVCVVELTGQDILDFLEYWLKDTKKEYFDAEYNSIGENGSFPCMSGIKFTVDLDKPSDVVVDDKDMLVGVNSRRVSDVLVLDKDTNEYVPIDPNRTYTVAAQDYFIKKGVSGSANYLVGKNIVANDICIDYELLIYYVGDVLKGDLSAYENVDNRITFLGKVN